MCHILPLHLASKFLQISLSFSVFQNSVLVVRMAFKAPSSVKREPFIAKCENLKEEQVTKRERKNLVKVNNILGHSKWTIIDFVSKFNLNVEGLDLRKNLNFLPTSKEVVSMFSKRQQNG